MFTIPIFVYSKKVIDRYHLSNITMTANIPVEYNWNTSTVTINGQTVTNPYYIDVRNGVEIVTENGTKYIKVQDYYLTENFSNTTNFNSAASLDVGYAKALWANSTTSVNSTTAQGVVGRVECAYEVKSLPLNTTSSSASNTNAFTLLKSLSSKTSNTTINEAGDSPANKIILGSTLAATETTTTGNSLTGTSSYNNNPVYYPFTNGGSSGSLYGSNNNIVPSGASVTKVAFTSTSAGTYSLAGKLVLGFDLYSGSTLINSNVQVELLSSTNLPFTDIDGTSSFISINNLSSQNIIFKNVRLKNVDATQGQTFESAPFATSIYTTLTLTVSATYTNPSSSLVTTQPEVTSTPYLIRTSAGTEFSGFGSLTLYNVNSEYGIDVNIRFAETLEGLASTNYTFLGTATGTGSETVVLNLSNDDQNPLFEAAKRAKYVQVNLKGKVNTLTSLYNQSTLDRVFVVTQIDLRNRSFRANSFPDKLKFPKATAKTVYDTVFGPFILKNEGPNKQYSVDNKATYGSFGYKYGVIKLEHLKHTALTYHAKNTLTSDTSTQPLYTPTQAAKDAYTARVVTSGRTKHLVLKYDVVVVQGDDRNPNITRYGNSTFSNNLNDFLNQYFGSPGVESNKTNPVESKSVYITSGATGFDTPIPDQINLQRQTATFQIPKTISYVDTERVCSVRRSARTGFGGEAVCERYETDFCASCCPETTSSLFDNCTAQCCQKTYCVEYGYQEREYCEDIRVSKKVNNIFFTFGFVNFKEVVVEYDPVSKKLAEVWSQPYDVNNNINAQEVIGLWVGTSSTTTNYIEPVFSTTDSALSFVPTKIVIPAINFDEYSVNSATVKKSFTGKLLIEFLDNTDTPISGATISRTITESSIRETVVEAPSNISNVKKLRTYIGLEPTGLTEYETGSTSTAATKLGIAPKRYIVNSLNDYTDVGLDFAAKMRIEYIDTSVVIDTVKEYVKSQAISNAYDLFTISGVSYSIDSNNYPVLKGNLLLEGTTAIPDGTDIKVEWSGSADGSTGWTSWTTDTTSVDLNKRYIRFKVTLEPENVSTGTGYKSPIIDEIKIKFWPYNVPYIEKYALGLSDVADQATLTYSKLNPEAAYATDIEYKVSTNNGTNYTTLTEPLIVKAITSPYNNAKVRVNFLTDKAKLNELVVDLFGSDATAVTTTTTSTTTTTTI